MIAPVLFFVFAGIAVVAAIMVIVHRNPIYCALFLFLTMFAVAGLYVLLNATLIAVVHIVVYAGAIMVLFLFVVMLLDLSRDAAKEKVQGAPRVIALLAAGVLFVELALFIKNSTGLTAVPAGSAMSHSESIGVIFFTKYLFPFEITSVLLLSALIGSAILAKLKLNKGDG